MLDVTIRLEERRLHLVRRATDCDDCPNHAAHTPLDARPFLQAEIERAVRGNASALADLRELVALYVPLPPAHGVLDAEILRHVAWLLQTGRLRLFECLHVRRELPDAPRPQAKDVPRGRSVPLEDEKTWVEIELLDDFKKPVAGQRYRVKVPGGVIHEGALDAKGRAKITNLDSGTCDISFPDIDGREWKPA